MKDLVEYHRQLHPLMEAQDVVKLVFQAMLGCGHLLGDEALVARRIEQEIASLTPDTEEPLTEPLGPDYVRLNLRRALADGLDALRIARLMKLSPASTYTRQDVVDVLSGFGEDVTQAAKRFLTEPEWLPSHTPAYHAAYAPAYRVISTQCATLLPVLCAIAKLKHKERLLICIDGPCGSGKTTVGNLLQQVLDAALIPMDDFFLPHPQKTPERLAQPGGNADWERVVSEVLVPWASQQPVSYRPYDCHASDFTAPVNAPPRRITLIEGSYSLMPAIRQYADISVFLSISHELQHTRILHRNGEAGLDMFIRRWIPLEKAYHTAFTLPDEQCIVLEQPQQSI
ncbi:MAG: hypothetical protein J6K13_06695 [Clostridia bacterium]|nr:hypothetical protein [Clostridia bacterium]